MRRCFETALMVTPDTAGNAASVWFRGRYPDPKPRKAKMRRNFHSGQGGCKSECWGLATTNEPSSSSTTTCKEPQALHLRGTSCVRIVQGPKESNCVTSNDLSLLVKVSATC